MAVDTLVLLLTLLVTSTDEQDRTQVGQLAQQVQEVIGETVEVVFVEQGYTGQTAEQAAGEQEIRLEVVKLPDAKRSFVLLPRRWGGRAQFRLVEPISPTGKRL